MNLNVDVRARLDAHLDAVEKALVEAKCSRERRRGIVDDLEAQIADMLAARSPEPTVADLEAVLATLDPPAAYADGGPTGAFAAGVGAPAGTAIVAGVASAVRATAAAAPKLSRMALAGFMCILGSMLASALALIIMVTSASFAARPASLSASTPMPLQFQPEMTPDVQRAQLEAASRTLAQEVSPRPKPFWSVLISGMLVMLLPVPLGLIGTVLGWLALGRIRSSNGSLYGSALALFDGMFYPLICGGFLFLIFPVPMILLGIVVGMIVGVWFLVRLIPAHA